MRMLFPHKCDVGEDGSSLVRCAPRAMHGHTSLTPQEWTTHKPRLGLNEERKRCSVGKGELGVLHACDSAWPTAMPN